MNPPTPPTPLTSPFWYAVGSIFAAPLVGLFCVLMGAMMLLGWPFIPFLVYCQRRDEIRKLAEDPANKPPADPALFSPGVIPPPTFPRP